MRLARARHGRGGLHTTLSLWLVTGMALGSFAATLVYAVTHWNWSEPADGAGATMSRPS